MRDDLLRFGADVCHVRHPAQVLERIGSAMSETLATHRTRIDAAFLDRITREWDGGRLWTEPDRVFARRPAGH